MANIVIHKFRFPESLDYWCGETPIVYSQTANVLMDNLSESGNALVLCGLRSKDDLLQIINFFQRKKTLKDMNLFIVIVDFQEGGKLLEAAQRLTIDRLIKGDHYLANEEDILTRLVDLMKESFEKYPGNQTYEELFGGSSTFVVKNSSKRRIYPVEADIEIPSNDPHRTITETPVVSFGLYEGDKLIESTFVDYFDREVILNTKELPTDKNLILEFKFSYLGEKKGLRLKTEVISIDEDEGQYQVTLRVQSHQKELETMFKIFQKREQNITEFLKKVRGY